MKKIIFTLFTIAVLLAGASCGNDNSNSGTTTPTGDSAAVTANNPEGNLPENKTVDPPAVRKLCFLDRFVGEPYIYDGDTQNMIDSTIVRLEIKGENVTGEYRYQPAEKDWNTGPFKGTIKDNVITVVHEWNMEGDTGLEEKIFKLEDDKLMIMGGAGEEIDGVFTITDKENVSVAETLAKVACW